MKDTDIIYMAGIVDGEGSINISKYKYRENGYRYWLSLSVTNCSRDLVEWIKERWGGTIYTKKPTRNGRAVYQWALANRNVEDLMSW